MKATVAPLTLPADRRVLVISDIHTAQDFFHKLLEKVGYSDNDTLILLGDMVEKGGESLSFLRHLITFAAGRDIRFVRGNCDNLVLECARGGGAGDAGLWDYLCCRPESILWQMGAEQGFVPQGENDIPQLRQLVGACYGPLLDFIASWPVILESDTMIFVHGGVARDEQLEDYQAWGCMKNDNFLNQETHLRRWCVVGHTPVTLYHPHIPSASPIIDRQKKIISIDGGCALKLDGQLNCLIIPHLGSEDFDWCSYDGNQTAAALDAQKASHKSINIRWGDNVVEVMARGGEFSLCRHRRTGHELYILTDYLYEKAGETLCQDATDYQLPVTPGDRLAIVRATSRGYLAKRQGSTGWYSGRLTDFS